MRGIGSLALRTFFLLFFTALPLFSQQFPDNNVHQLLTSGINSIIGHEYESAKKVFIKLKNEYPELPLGEIYLAAVEITRSYDEQTNFDDEYISVNLQKAFQKSVLLLKNSPEDKWNLYFAGMIKGYSAYYKALNEKWFSALSDGLDAVDYFEQCIAKDSSFYEAYVYIGIFKYWKSRKLEGLLWLPFITDESAAGLVLLEKAVNHSAYNRYFAVLSLIWIYIDQQEYSSAILLAENTLNIHPSNRFFKWGLGRAYEEQDKRKSIEVYQNLLNSYSTVSSINNVVLKHKIAQQYYAMGNNSEALKLCREILSNTYDKITAEKIHSRLIKVRELVDRINM
jgi:hypothetical protein